MSKRRDRPYQGGRSKHWVKCKNRQHWPAPGSEDTELRCLMEQEAGHGEATVYAGVQG